MDSKEKPLNEPQDVAYFVCNHDFTDCSTEKQNLYFSGDNNGNMFKAVGRNNTLNGVSRKQYTNTCMSTFDVGQTWSCSEC
jgi:hypothetical protein